MEGADFTPLSYANQRSFGRLFGAMLGCRRRPTSTAMKFSTRGAVMEMPPPTTLLQALGKGPAGDDLIAGIVSVESEEDNSREAVEEIEDQVRFELRKAFIMDTATLKQRCTWTGLASDKPTPLQIRTMNDNFFRLMHSRVRQDFHKIFPFGVVNSALSERAVASLVAAQVMIDMALMDEDLYSVAFPFLPGTRVSLENCPPMNRHMYFSFMAFKFSEVRANPDGLRDLVVLYYYHVLQKDTLGDTSMINALNSLIHVLRPVIGGVNFQRALSSFYLDTVRMEEEFRAVDLGVSGQCESYSTTIGFTFQRGALIGEGTSGRVYSCYRVPGDRMYALKVVSLATGRGNSADREGVVRGEIAMLHRLRHPRVISYYGCYFDRARRECGIMMEYAPQTLRRRIDETGGLPLHTISKVSRQILEGLAYLHENHVVHQDIKAANILIGAHRSIKLGDLGTAAITEVSANCVSLVGTPLFMAPEVCRYSRPSEASDIWSFGCVLIELSTGGLPWGDAFRGLEPAQIIFQIASATSHPLIPPNCRAAEDQEFCDFFSQCVQMDAFSRPSATALLSHPFLSRQWSLGDDSILDYAQNKDLQVFEGDLATLTDDDEY